MRKFNHVIAQWINVLVAKPDNQSTISRTHRLERVNSWKLSSDLHAFYRIYFSINK